MIVQAWTLTGYKFTEEELTRKTFEFWKLNEPTLLLDEAILKFEKSKHTTLEKFAQSKHRTANSYRNVFLKFFYNK